MLFTKTFAQYISTHLLVFYKKHLQSDKLWEISTTMHIFGFASEHALQLGHASVSASQCNCLSEWCIKKVSV